MSWFDKTPTEYQQETEPTWGSVVDVWGSTALTWGNGPVKEWSDPAKTLWNQEVPQPWQEDDSSPWSEHSVSQPAFVRKPSLGWQKPNKVK